MASQEAIQIILGIEGEIHISPEEMVKDVKIVFFPYSPEKISKEVLLFSKELEKSLRKLGVQIIPFKNSLVSTPPQRIIKWYFYALINHLLAFLKQIAGLKHNHDRPGLNILSKIRMGKRVREGISIIALGEGKEGNLPIDYLANLKSGMVVTIIDMPPGVHDETDFITHFNTSMNLFAHHMTHIVIGVDEKKWILYNLNAAHPIHLRNTDSSNHILKTLIPKLAAPIKPPRLSEFVIKEEDFDPNDKFHKLFVQDMIDSGTFFEETKLYPPGKSLNDLPFRNEFYRWIGKRHLDDRSGMSYGFLARQLPVKLPGIFNFNEAKDFFGETTLKNQNKDYLIKDDKIYLAINFTQSKIYFEIPEVWVLTQRSGCDKTHFIPSKDLIKIGLSRGKMTLSTPKGLKIQEGYRPSYDTKIILAHAVGNAIVANILRYFRPNSTFPKMLENNGASISHWHGYFKKDIIPSGWYVHGLDKPHVSCSTPQAAIYALSGKIQSALESIKSNANYLGDIHIEPHHGTNITFTSLMGLSQLLLKNPHMSKLGNHYLTEYKI